MTWKKAGRCVQDAYRLALPFVGDWSSKGSNVTADQDISHQALQLARALDRQLRRPGRYTITIIVPAKRDADWQADISFTHPLQRIRLRKGKGRMY